MSVDTWAVAWAHVLTRLEQQLDVTERTLDDGRYDELDPTAALPSLDVPLPAALAPRAEALQTRMAVLAARVGTALSRTRAELDAVAGAERPDRTERPPAFVDARA